SCCLPHVMTRSARRSVDFGAQWLACVYPCPGYTRDLTIASVGLGARMDRYSFPVRLFHPLLLAGLSRRFPLLLYSFAPLLHCPSKKTTPGGAQSTAWDRKVPL